MNFFGLILTIILFYIFKHFNFKFPIIINVGLVVIIILKIFLASRRFFMYNLSYLIQLKGEENL